LTNPVNIHKVFKNPIYILCKPIWLNLNYVVNALDLSEWYLNKNVSQRQEHASLFCPPRVQEWPSGRRRSRWPTKRPNDDFTADRGLAAHKHPRRRTKVAPHHLLCFLRLIYCSAAPATAMQAESEGALWASFPAPNVINRLVVVVPGALCYSYFCVRAR
jgi:hypothetical protein